MEYINLKDCAIYSSKRTSIIEQSTYISTENMLPNKGGISVVESVPDCRTTSKYEPSDILISNIRPYFCKIWFATREGGCSNDVLVIKANKGVDPKFLYYVLSDKNFFNYDTVTSKGTKMPRGNKNAIMKYLVPKVNLHTQQKIASIFSTYDTLIDNNTKRIRLLEQMAENLYKEWFVRFRFPGHENVEMENSLPKGWNIVSLKEQYTTSSGGTPSRSNQSYYEGNIPWIKTSELKGSFIFDTEEHISEEAVKKSAAKIIKPYCLLLAMYAGANVGNMGFNTTEATCNQACCVFESKASTSLEYLFYYLQTRKEYLQCISFGAAQQNISQDIIKKLKVIIPTECLVKDFTNRVRTLHGQIQVLQQQNTLLTRQRDLLLPRLMSGKLEVQP